LKSKCWIIPIHDEIGEERLPELDEKMNQMKAKKGFAKADIQKTNLFISS